MKNPDDGYTVIIFRGTRANPLRLRMRKALVRYTLIGGLCVLVLQGGFFAHYLFQRSQLTDLEGLREELSTSREQTNIFEFEIDSMKRRMVVLESLNQQLQTMFGLAADEIENSKDSTSGQGGEEIPYENIPPNETPNSPPPSHSMRGIALPHAGNLNSEDHKQIAEMAEGLRWLNQHADIEQNLLDTLAGTASKRAKRLASTPSIWPVRGAITSKFGPRISPFTGKKALHAGIDISAPKGTKIYAPAAGKVAVAGFDARMGKFVRLDHGFGMETTYGHLSRIFVNFGTKVQRGDVIGLVGSTGKFSTGPHLHYQIAVNDRVVDPVQYILD